MTPIAEAPPEQLQYLAVTPDVAAAGNVLGILNGQLPDQTLQSTLPDGIPANHDCTRCIIDAASCTLLQIAQSNEGNNPLAMRMKAVEVLKQSIPDVLARPQSERESLIAGKMQELQTIASDKQTPQQSPEPSLPPHIQEMLKNRSTPQQASERVVAKIQTKPDVTPSISPQPITKITEVSSPTPSPVEKPPLRPTTVTNIEPKPAKPNRAVEKPAMPYYAPPTEKPKPKIEKHVPKQKSEKKSTPKPKERPQPSPSKPEKTKSPIRPVKRVIPPQHTEKPSSPKPINESLRITAEAEQKPVEVHHPQTERLIVNVTSAKPAESTTIFTFQTEQPVTEVPVFDYKTPEPAIETELYNVSRSDDESKPIIQTPISISEAVTTHETVIPETYLESMFESPMTAEPTTELPSIDVEQTQAESSPPQPDAPWQIGLTEQTIMVDLPEDQAMPPNLEAFTQISEPGLIEATLPESSKTIFNFEPASIQPEQMPLVDTPTDFDHNILESQSTTVDLSKEDFSSVTAEPLQESLPSQTLFVFNQTELKSLEVQSANPIHEETTAAPVQDEIIIPQAAESSAITEIQAPEVLTEFPIIQFITTEKSFRHQLDKQVKPLPDSLTLVKKEAIGQTEAKSKKRRQSLYRYDVLNPSPKASKELNQLMYELRNQLQFLRVDKQSIAEVLHVFEVMSKPVVTPQELNLINAHAQSVYVVILFLLITMQFLSQFEQVNSI